jgi:hypothetical protein
MMKYEPINVISQITTRRTRPIGREPPSVVSRLSPEHAKILPLAERKVQNGANISQVFRDASKFLHTEFL